LAYSTSKDAAVEELEAFQSSIVYITNLENMARMSQGVGVGSRCIEWAELGISLNTSAYKTANDLFFCI
jgi:hypothetical protein